MANTIEYAQIFQRELDKAAVEEATSGWMELNDKLIQYSGGSEVKIPSIEMDGLADYDRQAGFVEGSVSLTYETKKMTQDRGRQFLLDAMDVNESNFVVTAAAVMGEFQRTKVVPEMDAYRYSTIAKAAIGANKAEFGYTPAEATILKTLLDDIALVQDKVGDATPLVITMSRLVAAIFDNSDKLGKKLDVTNFTQGSITMQVKTINGIPIIRAGSDRLKTNYVFKDGKTSGQEKGGYVAAADAQDINWLITPRNGVVAVSRTNKMRIFDPDTYQKADAWSLDYRRYHDLWIPKHKQEALLVNIKQSKPTTPTDKGGEDSGEG